jgi:hypothetical protein
MLLRQVLVTQSLSREQIVPVHYDSDEVPHDEQLPLKQVLEAQSLSPLHSAPSQLSIQNIHVAFTQLPLKQSVSFRHPASLQY